MTRRTNSDRANEAQQLLDKMEELTGVDEVYDQVSDIMCHLMHLCRLHPEKPSFDEALSLARINFEAEADEDPDV